MLEAVHADAVAQVFGLGADAVLEGPVAAGRLGDVWSLTTSVGRFAVKDGRFPLDTVECEADAAYQDRVRAAGVPMPAVVRSAAGNVLEQVAGTSVRVYDWVSVQPRERRLDPEAVGRTVATIHQVVVPAPGPIDPWFAEPVGAVVWDSLVDRLREAGAPFAEQLASLLPGQLEVEQLVARRDPVQRCHNDLWADNVRRGDDGLVVLDWENSGPGDPSGELALVLFEFGDSQPERNAALYSAYLAAGGPGRVRRPADFSTLIAQTAHIAVEACSRWLAATTDAARADNAAWAAEFLDEPVTLATVHQILDAVG